MAKIWKSIPIFLLLLVADLYAQSSVISGKVTEPDGKIVPNVPIRVIGMSEQRTSPTGEFRIELPNDVHPGDPITLSVIRPGWVIKSPPNGQLLVPRNPAIVISVVLTPAPVKDSLPVDQASLAAYTEAEDALLQDSQFYREGAERDEDEPYSLKVHISAKFRNGTFNSSEYLPGLSTLTCITPTCLYRLQIPEQFNKLTWIAYLGFEKRPSESDNFTFTTGPRTWSVKLGRLPWKEYRGSHNKQSLWYGAQASVALTLSDPDWVVLRSARLLRLVEKNQYILETIVENRSAIPAPLNSLKMELWHPQREGYACANPDHSVHLNLVWDRILSQSKQNDTDEPAAWAQLGESKVRVENHALLEGKCSDYRFHALVPIQVDVAPKTLVRVQMRISDFPTVNVEYKHNFYEKNEVAPNSLGGWSMMKIGLVGAFPQETEIDLGHNRQNQDVRH